MIRITETRNTGKRTWERETIREIVDTILLSQEGGDRAVSVQMLPTPTEISYGTVAISSYEQPVTGKVLTFDSYRELVEWLLQDCISVDLEFV